MWRGVPFVTAPELFGVWTDSQGYEQCFVRRQPVASYEIDQMVTTIATADLRCIRYGGRDRTILNRLVQIGEREVCDEPREKIVGRLLRLTKRILS